MSAIPIGGIFPILGVFNSFGDYIETNIYPLADWAKLCDGSVISDADSPLDGTYTPNLIGSVVVGDSTAGTIIPERKVATGIYAFGEYNPFMEVSNSDKTFTTKYFMRIK